MEWLVERKPLGVLYAETQPRNQEEITLLRDSVAGLAKRLEQDIYNWVKSREQRLSEVVKEFTGSTGTMQYRLRETIISSPEHRVYPSTRHSKRVYQESLENGWRRPA